jgi:hypothetical protein
MHSLWALFQRDKCFLCVAQWPKMKRAYNITLWPQIYTRLAISLTLTIHSCTYYLNWPDQPVPPHIVDLFTGRVTCPRPAVFNSPETAGAVEILSMIGYENPTDIYSWGADLLHPRQPLWLLLFDPAGHLLTFEHLGHVLLSLVVGHPLPPSTPSVLEASLWPAL